MFEFIKIQYLIGRLNADQVRGYAPRWITIEQADEIINSHESENKRKKQDFGG